MISSQNHTTLPSQSVQNLKKKLELHFQFMSEPLSDAEFFEGVVRYGNALLEEPELQQLIKVSIESQQDEAEHELQECFADIQQELDIGFQDICDIIARENVYSPELTTKLKEYKNYESITRTEDITSRMRTLCDIIVMLRKEGLADKLRDFTVIIKESTIVTRCSFSTTFNRFYDERQETLMRKLNASVWGSWVHLRSLCLIAANRIYDFQKIRKQKKLFAFFDETDGNDILTDWKEIKSGQTHKSGLARRRKLNRAEYRAYVRTIHIFLLELFEKLAHSQQEENHISAQEFAPETAEIVQVRAEDAWLDKRITLKKPSKRKGQNRLYVIKNEGEDYTAFTITPQAAYATQYLYDMKDKRVERRAFSYTELQEKFSKGTLGKESQTKDFVFERKSVNGQRRIFCICRENC